MGRPEVHWADDLEVLAREALGPALFGFIAGGAGEGRTVAANRAAFDRHRLQPRVLQDVRDVDLSTTILGRGMQAPIFVAPMGTHALVHPEGEMASTRAAKELGLGVIASSAASFTLEETAEIDVPSRWFQLYMFRDRGIVVDLMERAEAAGHSAICLTVDTPVLGDRRTDRRTRFTPDAGIRWSNLERYAAGALPDAADGTAVARYISEQLDPGLCWRDIDWLTQKTELPVVLKGILDPADALRAVSCGVQALVVSNHGGRQLDRVIASLDALPGIVDAVDGRVPVVHDGGIRDASDAVIALCLGAAAVTIGRPILWALAAGGPESVGGFLEEFVDDLRRSLQLLGRTSLSQLDRSLLRAA